jgi:hypothetical protein
MAPISTTTAHKSMHYAQPVNHDGFCGETVHERTLWTNLAFRYRIRERPLRIAAENIAGVRRVEEHFIPSL